MITGVHALINSRQPEVIREFLRDKIGWPHVDTGGGWLIFALPPAELGVHPDDGDTTHQLYLMCDQVEATMDELRTRGVEFAGGIQELNFGRMATIVLPDGSHLGLYEPKHALPPRPQG
jgi:predicted enzyme related to lactoylglutathione lyase